jgi:hypothetical protein
MTRNLKVLGLAVMAVLAMSVMAATAAQAKTFTASAGVYPVTGESSIVTPNIFTVEGGREVTCEKTVFHTTLPAASEQLTVTPTYSECHAKILGNKLDATVTFNKCDYLFTTSGLVHLECPNVGEDVEIHIYAGFKVPHEAATQICKYTIKPQTVNSVDYTNQSSGTTEDVLVTATGKEIKVEKTLGTKANCGQEKQEGVNGATYTGSVTVKGKNAGGTQVGIHVL